MTTIRLATEPDLPAILDIYNDAILNTTAVYDYKPHTLEMRQAWFAAKRLAPFAHGRPTNTPSSIRCMWRSSSAIAALAGCW